TGLVERVLEDVRLGLTRPAHRHPGGHAEGESNQRDTEDRVWAPLSSNETPHPREPPSNRTTGCPSPEHLCATINSTFACIKRSRASWGGWRTKRSIARDADVVNVEQSARDGTGGGLLNGGRRRVDGLPGRAAGERYRARLGRPVAVSVGDADAVTGLLRE